MDFETASPKRYSACSLALVVVRNSQIVDTFYSLIKPETEFSAWNTKIHGLHASDVADAPKFPEVWAHIQTLFEPNKLVVAHNARFDTSVLRSTLNYYDIEAPKYLALDTLKTSRHFYPEFPNHKLNTICDQLDIDLHHHHNALDDSVACANILLHEEQHFGDNALKPMVKFIQ
ncbi:DNA polymerase III, epsilon subunit related 3-5 exonuclease [Lactobacillus selangorensis]|uniref:DNA polymerase III polC-type n=2 Tax=Lactobacillus selangorensis TaxID=81857 RepID=A0A0R2FPB2_9LACO|nr:DNA polymerase III, epsilon subunit related 3-5 exonuclease [Lactobacillus selangorensis]KRN30370.1 DNA polymerase III, epsilon subunit related 3-5 exonuclease [Lactobacillus selangorensis]